MAKVWIVNILSYPKVETEVSLYLSLKVALNAHLPGQRERVSQWTHSPNLPTAALTTPQKVLYL